MNLSRLAKALQHQLSFQRARDVVQGLRLDDGREEGGVRDLARERRAVRSVRLRCDGVAIIDPAPLQRELNGTRGAGDRIGGGEDHLDPRPRCYRRPHCDTNVEEAVTVVTAADGDAVSQVVARRGPAFGRLGDGRLRHGRRGVRRHRRDGEASEGGADRDAH